MNGLRRLAPPDCRAVLRINAGSRPGVASLDEREFRRLLGISNLHLAMEDDGTAVVGYVLAFPGTAPYDGEEFIVLKKRIAGEFIYIDQVAVDPVVRRRGVASSLYRALRNEAARRSFKALCCEVNLVPPNPVSMAFHLEGGFEPLGELHTQDGRTVALMVKTVK